MNKQRLVFVWILLIGVCCCAKGQQYEESPNKGKSIAIFGGSFSVITPSNITKEYWTEKLGCKITNYGKGGAGFSVKTGEERYIPTQIDRAIESGEHYDLCILWASTNDCAHQAGIAEQHRQIALCINKIRKAMPHAKVLFFTSLPIPLLENFSFLKYYADDQVKVCKEMNVPCLDLYEESGLNKWNAIDFFGKDSLHLNEAGYGHIKETTARFIAAQR